MAPWLAAEPSIGQPLAATGSSGWSPAVGQLDHDLVEAERVLDAVADSLQHGVSVVRLGQPRRHLQHPLEHALVLHVR